MNCTPDSKFLKLLRGRITLDEIPFSERGSRLLVFRHHGKFYIRLTERWYKWENEFGPYRSRAPMIDDLELTDENGLPLEVEVITFPHALCFETRLGAMWLTFADEETLFFHLAPARIGLRFRVLGKHGRTDRRGGEFRGDPEHRQTHRNVAYTTNACFLKNLIQDDADGFLRVELVLDATQASSFLLNITPRLGLNRSIPPAEEVLSAAEQRWHAWFAAAPPVADEYQSQYYYAWMILRAGLISSRFFLTREAMVPSMIHYVGVWAWDAYFHSLAYRYIDERLAENQIRTLLDHQREDGMVPDAVHDEGVITRLKLPDADRETEVTKPPLVAWAALKLFRTNGNLDFLDELYEPLQRWHAWWLEKNDDDRDGIVQYNHPNSSGLDDSPLWDEGMPIESPDINTYLVMQLDSLAEMAELLGLPDDAHKWRQEAQALTGRLIEHFWDEQAGVFWAQREHRPIRVLTPFNLFPFLTRRLSPSMNERLLAHLLSPDEFWTTYPLPTVSRSDPKFEPNTMWRGPTWVNINYLFIEALARTGHTETARTLRDKTLALLQGSADIYEYYNPETGKPPPTAASVFGWSSAVFVDLAIRASRGEII